MVGMMRAVGNLVEASGSEPGKAITDEDIPHYDIAVL